MLERTETPFRPMRGRNTAPDRTRPSCDQSNITPTARNLRPVAFVHLMMNRSAFGRLARYDLGQPARSPEQRLAIYPDDNDGSGRERHGVVRLGIGEYRVVQLPMRRQSITATQKGAGLAGALVSSPRPDHSVQ